ncbi:metallophosphoesterase [Paenibacillus tritici]|uniref:Metallophosphoesterase n=1 Tax=Paenibacillus tritici TaxID=1873425 RepID=A0ABX2E0H7_9BACL|nr:metallophosphoesterase [Paenibacillus tritici]NQX49326.1 metallophosphoesterase [Paenibacillus tritici]
MEQVILHLSDLHFGSERGNLSKTAMRTLCLNNLLECIKEQSPEWQPTIICISGDIGYAGSAEDYVEASEWLSKLLEATRLDPSKIILCAGNHDVNRTETRGLSYPSNPETADKWLEWPVPSHILKPFEHFASFCKSFGIIPFKILKDEQYLVGAREVNGMRFVSFNSSWFCIDNDDRSKLWVGLSHIQAVENDGFLKLKRDSTDSPCIALIHHPREWLNDSEHTGYALGNRPNTIDYLAERCDLILTGHTHGSIRKPDKIADAAWNITAGATFDNPGHFNNFSIIKVKKSGFSLRRFEFDPRASDRPWEEKRTPGFFNFGAYVSNDNTPEDSDIAAELHVSDIPPINSGVFSFSQFPLELIDQKIKYEVGVLRKSRYFSEFDTTGSSLVLIRKLIEGELIGGSNGLKSQAIALCVRFMVRTYDISKVEEYLEVAIGMGSCKEIEIAKAFIYSQKGELKKALSLLAGIDSPDSRSAAMMIISHHEGAEKAVNWPHIAGIKIVDFDLSGKVFLISNLLELARWSDALEIVYILTNKDKDELPILYHLVAIVYLTSAIPLELRATVLNQLPIDIRNFPLASDENAIKARRIAHENFIKATEIAEVLKLTTARKMDDEYAIWLEMTEPEFYTKGRQRLEEKLRDPRTSLGLVPLGLQFDIKLDLIMVEQEIERQIALNGGITRDAAITRFALAFTRKNPEDIANYVIRHSEELETYFDRKSLRFLQIDMFSKAGFADKANAELDLLLNEGISPADEFRLRNTIAEIKGTDLIEIRKSQFKQTGSISDLYSLVEELENKEEWISLCEYGDILFQKTRSTQDAERLATALYNAQETERLIEMIEANDEFLSQSKSLHLLYCWALYNEGDLLKARSEFEKLNNYIKKDSNYRALQVSLGIALGEWHYLTAFVANEYMEKDDRSAYELIKTAQLAYHLTSPYAKDLMFAASEKGVNDANVLTAAYFLATTAGWENDIKISQWLQMAADLSGEDGPIQTMTLKDLIDRKPDWEQRESETLLLLKRGEIPQFLAADSLNRSLINFMLFPALVNLSLSDPRRRSTIPAYNGNRQAMNLDKVDNIAIEATALLTLSFLDLLERVFDYFNTIYLPHSTMHWLFEEKQKVSFHQPSRIKDAHKVSNLIATGVLEKFVQSALIDNDLSNQIGDSLAKLISEAEKDRQDNIQRIVVRSSPVHRINSLMEEEADLTAHTATMSSCQIIVDKLRQKGQITAEEHKRATAYLQFHEKPWPNQPEIKNGAILYLDDVAVNYFLHLGMLGKIQAAGFTAIISTREVLEANELISYESISSDVSQSIERIRSVVSLRIQDGKIKIGRRQNIKEWDKQSITDHPTVGVISLATYCDAILSDDRFLNQHEHVDNGQAQAKTLSTVDVLEMMASNGTINSDELLEIKTKLRRAGYYLVPIATNELEASLVAASVKEEVVIETAELKAIRESILQVRMSSWFQLPKEANWLDNTFKTLLQVLMKFWRVGTDLNKVIAYSNWIFDLMDIRGWSQFYEKEIADNLVKTGRGVFILMLLTPSSNIPNSTINAYWDWLEERVLIPIKEESPELYTWIINWLINEIIEMSNSEELAEKLAGNPHVKKMIVLSMLNKLPPIVRTSLLEHQQFSREFSGSASYFLMITSELAIRRYELYDAFRKIYSGKSNITVQDNSGREWNLEFYNQGEKESPYFLLSLGEESFILPQFTELSHDRATRLDSFDRLVFDVNLPITARESWRSILSEHSFNDDEMDAYRSDLDDTPILMARSMREDFENRQCNVSNLVPSSRRYYERLIGCYDGSVSIKEYAKKIGRQLFQQLSEWTSYNGFLWSLFLSSHSELTAEIDVEDLESEEIIRIFGFLEEYGDKISQLGAVEIGLRILPEKPEIEPIIIRLMKQIRDDDVDKSDSGFKLLSALFILVDGELSRIRLFSGEPPFYRRLASLSQAALIQRELLITGIDIQQFCKWALSTRVEQYYFQTLSDMRLEPRWNPDFAFASQLKAEFLSRILIAAKNYEGHIKDGELRDLVFGSSSNLFAGVGNLFFPGPLEGTSDNTIIMPAEVMEIIELQLSNEKVSPSSFVALINSAFIFNIELKYAEMAAKALRLSSYQLSNLVDSSQLYTTLNGLSAVAAVSRSSELANDLRILVRRYRMDSHYNLSVEEAMRICLIAAASCEDLEKWSEFVGNCFSDIAFGVLEGNEDEIFLSHLQSLCHAVPELWFTCGKVDAALRACISSRSV